MYILSLLQPDVEVYDPENAYETTSQFNTPYSTTMNTPVSMNDLYEDMSQRNGAVLLPEPVPSSPTSSSTHGSRPASAYDDVIFDPNNDHRGRMGTRPESTYDTPEGREDGEEVMYDVPEGRDGHQVANNKHRATSVVTARDNSSMFAAGSAAATALSPLASGSTTTPSGPAELDDVVRIGGRVRIRGTIQRFGVVQFIGTTPFQNLRS